MAKKMKVLGIMSGSSLDGLDLALCSFDSNKWKLESTAFYPLDESLKTQLQKGINLTALELWQTDLSFCKAVSDAVLSFPEYDNVDLIASHGHTLYHVPEQGISIQIGNGGVLSSLCEKDVISDFRIQDVNLGGEGTPLVAIAERDLFPGYDYYLNLGGIANISFSGDQWKAYDVCPCNQVLNHFANDLGFPFDKEGALAQAGTLDIGLYDTLRREEYFLKEAPKSLDNNWIQDYWIPQIKSHAISAKDILRTYTELIVELIFKDLKPKASKSKIFVSGGGVKNKFLLDILAHRCNEINMELIVPDEEMLDFKEAILMAYLGYLRKNEQVNILKEITRAKQSVSGGAYYLAPKKKDGQTI